jgi:hypothetical protein
LEQKHSNWTLLKYYTPKTIQMQATMGKITLFVNYDDFYVNIVMSTRVTASLLDLQFSTATQILRRHIRQKYYM